MAEIEHGTRRGMRSHINRDETLCATCCAFDRDRQRAYRVLRGQAKDVHISTLALARILRGWRPEVALAGEIGPLTLDALRGYGAESGPGSEKRGV